MNETINFIDEIKEYSAGNIFVKQTNTANNGSLISGISWGAGSNNLFPYSFVTAGSPARIEVTNPNLANGSGDFTISMWANTGNDMSAGTRRLFNLSGTSGRIEVQMAQTSALLQFTILDGGSTTTISTTGSYNDGIWHHFGFLRYTGSDRLYTYVDGALVKSGIDTTNIGSTIATGLPKLFIGAHPAVGPNQTFIGSLADIRFYNRVLSPNEIGSLYSGLSVNGGLSMWLYGNEGSGTLAADNSYSSTPFSQVFNGFEGTIIAVNTTNASVGRDGSIFIIESGTNEKILTLKKNSLRSEHPEVYGTNLNGGTGSPWTHLHRTINKPFYILGSDLTSTFNYDDISISYS